MSSPARVHDPLFHFETHFPERLSRLHLNPEYGNHPIQRKNKKSRAARQGIRYKTQPVTFDEIQEVDEETIKEEEKAKADGLKNQFTAFSKSMDGLVPKQKTKKTADSIDENMPVESCHAKSVKNSLSEIGRVQSAEQRLTEEEDKENKENEPHEPSNMADPSRPVSGLPPSGPNTQRRQRTTAKAKKRQIQAEVQGGGDSGT